MHRCVLTENITTVVVLHRQLPPPWKIVVRVLFGDGESFCGDVLY